MVQQLYTLNAKEKLDGEKYRLSHVPCSFATSLRRRVN